MITQEKELVLCEWLRKFPKRLLVLAVSWLPVAEQTQRVLERYNWLFVFYQMHVFMNNTSGKPFSPRK